MYILGPLLSELGRGSCRSCVVLYVLYMHLVVYERGVFAVFVFYIYVRKGPGVT